MGDHPPGKPLAIELVPQGEFLVASFAEVHLLPAALIVPNSSLNDGVDIPAVWALQCNPNNKPTILYLNLLSTTISHMESCTFHHHSLTARSLVRITLSKRDHVVEIIWLSLSLIL